ncbi:MAG TPA: N-acetylmuramic acid 6-phosphate etherase, partial [Firmicutes bacterium]|nr:N-acetylmuramic acid 6-phosphate etherase [Bacillota bacterium]
MKENLGALVTESQNLDYVNLDEMNSEEIVRAMNKED